MAIPTSLDQIDAAFLTGVLGKTVDAVDLQRIAVGEGFLGELARLTLSYGDGSDGPRSLIAKIPTTDGGLKPIGLMLQVYEREARAYNEVIPQLKVRTANAVYNEMDVEADEYCLILEDVGHLEAGDHHAGGTLDQARAAMIGAARMHGRWWGNVDELDWVPPIDSPLNLGLQGMAESSFPGVVDMYGHLLGDDVVAHLERFIPTISEMLVAYGSMSRTLSHNDFRLDNMFFDDGELVLIDWQLVGRGDGMGDLCPFMSTNFDSEFRRRHEQDLFRLYFDTISSMNAGYLEFDDLMRSYFITLNFWLAMWCHSGATKGDTTQRGEELFERAISRGVDAYRQHEAWQYIGDFEPHNRYR
jgi:hypothetical protein